MSYDLNPNPFMPYCPPSDSRNLSQFYSPDKDATDASKPQHFVKTLFIDSRNRNVDARGPFDFIVNLEADVGISPYQLVHSVDLKMIAMPKIANEHYFVLDIAELNGQYDSNDNPTDAKFCTCFFDGIASADGTTGMQPGDIKVIKSADVVTRTVVFNPPTQRLGRLSIRVLKHGGAVVDPTVDTGGVDYFSMILQVDLQTRTIH